MGKEDLALNEGSGGGAGRSPAQQVLVFKRQRGGVAFGGALLSGMMGGGMTGGSGSADVGGGFGGFGGAPFGGEGPGMRKNLFEVVKLKTAKADEVAASLRKVYPAAKLRVVAEAASNSVIIIDADGAVLKDVRAMIQKLDASTSSRLPMPGGGEEGGSGGLSGGPGGGLAPGGLGGAGFGSPGMGSPAGMMAGGGNDPLGKGGLALNVFNLKHAESVEMAKLLKQIFPATDFTADARTNALICRADPETLDMVRALLIKLDVEVSKKP